MLRWFWQLFKITLNLRVLYTSLFNDSIIKTRIEINALISHFSQKMKDSRRERVKFFIKNSNELFFSMFSVSGLISKTNDENSVPL